MAYKLLNLVSKIFSWEPLKAIAKPQDAVVRHDAKMIGRSPLRNKFAQPRTFDFKKTVTEEEFQSAREIVRAYNIQAILSHISFMNFLRRQGASTRLLNSFTTYLNSKIASGEMTIYKDIEEIPVMFFVDRFDAIELLRLKGVGKGQFGEYLILIQPINTYKPIYKAHLERIASETLFNYIPL